tara:strand:+ start:183 stop:416 length:234 start_codon:yes stop_codon:yes gene_type:complete
MMNTLLDEFDLITAERISGYLKERIAQLTEYMQGIHVEELETIQILGALIKELRELKIHIDGDLNSMLNDMEAGSYR